MTDGRTFALVAFICAVAGLVVGVSGEFLRDAYLFGGGGCLLLFAVTFAILSLRDR